MPTIDDSFLAVGEASTGFGTNFNPDSRPSLLTGVGGCGAESGVLGRGGQAEGPRTNNVYSRHGGVVGESRDHPGTTGASINNIGVYGQTEQSGAVPNLIAGVYGTGNLRPGVFGSSSQNVGVQGSCFLGSGVRGTSFRGGGVTGQSSVATGVNGVSNTFGPAVRNTVDIAGVRGTSDGAHGVIGTSNRSIGVLGFSNNIGVYGESTNPASFAGLFVGNVQVTGALTAAVKNAVVPFPDGSKRVVHCVESPEHWFEDFGGAKLRNGRTVVKLDADFAKVIKSGDYRVFVTPEGDCRGLSVRRRAAGFEVRELAGGKSNVEFSYRIVGRRKDIKAHKRFAKIDTRLPLPATPTRAQRMGAPTRRDLNAFVASVEKEAGEPRPKGARKTRRLP
jgi:hypothetical protein